MSVTERTRRAPADERARLRAIDEYWIVGATPPPDLRAVAELAAYVCRVPYAAVNIIDGELQHRVAAVGVEPGVCARQDSMCSVTIDEPEPVVVPDARCDPRFATNPWVTGAMGEIRFYAGAQLHGLDGHVLGTLCVFDDATHGDATHDATHDDATHELDEAQLARLVTLARIVVDVFELRRRDRALRAALVAMERTGAELSRSNTALQNFAARLSDDLRNPLTGMVGYLSALAGLPAVAADPPARHGAERAVAAAGRMRRTVDDVLRHAAASGEPNRRPVRLDDTAAQVREDLAPLVRSSRATLTIEPLPTVIGDPTQLRVLLRNLLDNAMKFRRADRPAEIRVCGETMRDRWRLRVADNGVGIPADQRNRVREMFTRLHPEIEGSGVGLATCQRVAAAHDADLFIEETRGGGTTVTLSIPRPGARHASPADHPDPPG
jgi:signal transduction histidine kinase